MGKLLKLARERAQLGVVFTEPFETIRFRFHSGSHDCVSQPVVQPRPGVLFHRPFKHHPTISHVCFHLFANVDPLKGPLKEPLKDPLKDAFGVLLHFSGSAHVFAAALAIVCLTQLSGSRPHNCVAQPVVQPTSEK